MVFDRVLKKVLWFPDRRAALARRARINSPSS
jgi:hypothetical protein